MKIESEIVSCAVCGNTGYKVLGRGRDFEFNTSDDVWQTVECISCSHVFLNPRPAINSVRSIYPSDYYPALDFSTASQRFILQIRSLLERPRYTQLRKYFSGSPHIIDFGAGDGRVLFLLRRIFGPTVRLTALDIKFDAQTKEAFRQFGINFSESLLESIDESSFLEKADVVIMTQVVEHLWNPNKVLKSCREILKDNGIIFIETPNPKSFCRKLQGDVFWGGFHRPRHLNLFGKEPLVTLARNNHYDLLSYRQFTVPAFWIVGLRNRLGLTARGGSGRFLEFISMRNIFVLGFFTVLEGLVGFLGMSRSNHRFLFELKVHDRR